MAARKRTTPPKEAAKDAPAPIGCICPPTAERTCKAVACPRQDRRGFRERFRFSLFTRPAPKAEAGE